MKNAHAWTVALLLAFVLAFIHIRGGTDQVPDSEPLAAFPANLGPWQGQDIPIPQEQLDILGKGVFLNRSYRDPLKSEASAVGLFIAYFPTQRSGQSIHSPQNCLPGAGWNFDTSGTTEWTDASGTYRVGEYLISNGTDRQEVLYWYRSHGKNIANDYVAKFHMLTDSILYRRTDAALVRVITPISRTETQADARVRAVGFAQNFDSLLAAYVPN